MILDKVNYPNDIKKLNIKEKEELSEELRQKIIETVSKTGGHLASNLGIVELTIAVHSSFNMPEDKIIWDVGHQTYVHKILTGRKDKFETLRKLNGLSGFPKCSESEYDSFDTGHSSTSISVALGMARARDILGKKNKVVAIIGDGALTGGMALEAINDAGISGTNLIVILNDNEMSISKNTGGLSLLLAKLRTKKLYIKSNISGKKIIGKIPFIGKGIVKLVVNIKRTIKQLIIPKMYFENVGFRYLGPVNGHNIEQLESILNISKELDGPVLIHVLTKKGKGYSFAEESPNKYHSTPKFNIETGEKYSNGEKDYSTIMGEKIVDLARKDPKIVAVTAAMEEGTGLSNFAKEFPDRFFDVEIAEQHALGMIAGMAKEGLKPVFPVYSSFLQRGYDQLIHDICLQNLPVTICIDRAGIVGSDGETHHGIFDLSYLNTIPNINILAPKNFEEFEKMLEFSVNYNGPVAIRYPKGGESKTKFSKSDEIKLGKAELIKNGKDVTIVAIGKMVATALEVQKNLENDIDCEIINVRFLKPIDKDMILSSARKTKKIITIEDNLLIGGLGTTVNELLKNENVYIENIGYNDLFVQHGNIDEIEKIHNLDDKSIAEKIQSIVRKQDRNV